MLAKINGAERNAGAGKRLVIDRRKFLRAALFVAAAPVIVRASSLMKVRSALVIDDPDLDFTTDGRIYGVERLLPIQGYPGWGTFAPSVGYRVGDVMEFSGNQYLVKSITP